jgi:putative NADH-flavin reductase
MISDKRIAMNIALIGATGFVGTAVLAELLKRGHHVTALARTPGKIAAQTNLTVVQADAQKADEVARAVAGKDAVISAYNPGWGNANIHDEFLKGSDAIVAGTKEADVKRLLVVGGAGSLYAAPGVQLVDTPEFPAEWKQGALAAREALNRIRIEDTLDWTFLSPAILLEPGAHEGPYRTGLEHPLMNGDHPARITVADMAIAIVDEIEKPQHIRRRFTVAY